MASRLAWLVSQDLHLAMLLNEEERRGFYIGFSGTWFSHSLLLLVIEILLFGKEAPLPRKHMLPFHTLMVTDKQNIKHRMKKVSCYLKMNMLTISTYEFHIAPTVIKISCILHAPSDFTFYHNSKKEKQFLPGPTFELGSPNLRVFYPVHHRDKVNSSAQNFSNIFTRI